MQMSWPSHDSQPKLGQGVPSLSRNWGNGLVYTASRSTGRFHTAMHRWRGHSQGVFWEWLDGLASMLAQAPGTDHTHPKAKIVRWYSCAFWVSSINVLDMAYWMAHNHTRRQDSCARNHVAAQVNFRRCCLWRLFHSTQSAQPGNRSFHITRTPQDLDWQWRRDSIRVGMPQHGRLNICQGISIWVLSL